MSAFSRNRLDARGKAGIVLGGFGLVAAVIAWFIKGNTDEKRAGLVGEAERLRRQVDPVRTR